MQGSIACGLGHQGLHTCCISYLFFMVEMNPHKWLLILLGVLQFGVQHTRVHSPRLWGKFTVRKGGLLTCSSLLASSPSLLWLPTCSAYSKSSVLTDYFCGGSLGAGRQRPGEVLGTFWGWKVGRDAARKSKRSFTVFSFFFPVVNFETT